MVYVAMPFYDMIVMMVAIPMAMGQRPSVPVAERCFKVQVGLKMRPQIRPSQQRIFLGLGMDPPDNHNKIDKLH